MKEVQLWERILWTGGMTPIHTTELHRYLGAVRRAVEVIAEARTVMAHACHRTDKP